MDQRRDRSPEAENSSTPNRNEICHHHGQAHSDRRGDPLDGMRAELAKSHHEICQSLLPHFRRRHSRVVAGIRHSQHASEIVQGMEELGHWTFA